MTPSRTATDAPCPRRNEIAAAVLEHDDLGDPRPISSRVAYHLSHCRDCLNWVESTRQTAHRTATLATAEVPAGLAESVLAVHEDFREGAAPSGRIDLDTIDVDPLGDFDPDAVAKPVLPLWPKLAAAAMIALVLTGGWLALSPSDSSQPKIAGDQPTPAVRRKRAPAPPPEPVQRRERTVARDTASDELTASAQDTGSQRRKRIWRLPENEPARRRIREQDICRHATYEEAAACEKSGVYHHAMHVSGRRGSADAPALPPLPEVPPPDPRR